MSLKSESESIHPAVRARPWAAKAEELAEKEGHYADYAAWEWWIEDRVCSVGIGDAGDILGDMDSSNKIALYVVMGKMADGNYGGKEIA